MFSILKLILLLLGKFYYDNELIDLKKMTLPNQKFYKLTIFTPEKRHETILVKYENNERISIGSDPNCDLILKDQKVSSRHCEIFIGENENLLIKDCNSKFGTLVSDSETIDVSSKEIVVQVGRSLFLFSQNLTPNINIYEKNGRFNRHKRSEVFDDDNGTVSDGGSDNGH